MPSPAVGSGGYVGALVAIFLEVHFGPVGMIADPRCGRALRPGTLPRRAVRLAVPGDPRLAASSIGGGGGSSVHHDRHSSGGSLVVQADSRRRDRLPAVSPSQPCPRSVRPDPADCRRRSPACAASGSGASPTRSRPPAADRLTRRRPRSARLAVRAAADGDARALLVVSDAGARGQGPRPGHAAGADPARFRLSGPRRPDRYRPGDHPVRDRARGRAAGLADHEPGRRPGNRPGGAERADRGTDSRQDDRRHRGPQRSPQHGPAGRGDRRHRRADRRNAASRCSWARTSRASPWSSTWPRCRTC